MEKKEPLKITKKIVGYKVVTPEEALIGLTSNPVEILEDIGLVEVGNLEAIKQYTDTKVTYLEAGEVMQIIKQPLKRPLRLDNEWRLKPPYSNHALYVRLNAIEYEGRKYPYEIFFNTKDVKDIKWLNALTVTISTAFRTAIETRTSLQPLIDNFKESCDTESPYLSRVPEKPKFVNGLVAEIGLVIEVFTNECNKWKYSQSSPERPATEEEKTASISVLIPDNEWQLEQVSGIEAIYLDNKLVKDLDISIAFKAITNPCPDCGSQLTKQAGCDVCLSCGYSKCS